LAHTYGAAGAYTVTATVTDDRGASSQTSATVTVTSVAAVTVSQPLAGATTSLRPRVVASGYAPAGVISMKIYLDSTLVFQTVLPSIDTTLSVTPGLHSLTVQQWDSNGVVTKKNMTNNAVNSAPVATLSLNGATGTAPVTVTASVAASDVDGNLSSTSIDFGDGTVVSGASASHSYSVPGSYTITATAKDSLGLAASSTAAVSVAAPPPPPPQRTVTLAPPKAGSVPLSVRVVGSASSPAPITAMKIYVDGKAAYTTSDSSVDTTVQTTAGSHSLTLQAWDSTGAVMKSTVQISVK
jgi:PKD repeat protein